MDLLKHGTNSFLWRPIILLTQIYKARIREPNVIGSGPAAVGRTGKDKHFLETLFEVWPWAPLVHRNRTTKIGIGTK